MNEGLKTTSVFDKNLEAYNEGYEIIINQGSTRSSKTISELQIPTIKFANTRKEYKCSVVSRSLPQLKLGAMYDFEKFVLRPYGIDPERVKNKTEHHYKINNSIIEFFGADQLDKVHGPARNWLIMNEAPFIKYDVFEQLWQRTDGPIFIDFNPTQRFWVHDNIMPDYKHKFIKSTYKDNEYLPDRIRQRLDKKVQIYLNKKARGEDVRHLENWYRVYACGEIGHNEGSVLTNWEYGEFDTSLNYIYGLDYGFYPDPDALVKVAIDEKRKIIYVDELIYETQQGTEDLISKLRDNINGRDLIIAESASPRTNFDVKKKGFNIKAVSKTKTVAEWLRIMQDYKIVITERSYNLEKELSSYVWSDKKAGIPIDDFNHLIDAIRYVFMEKKRGKAKIKSSHHS